MKMKNKNEYPEITKRILSIINDKFDGNVRQFSFALGLTSSSKINRLFLKDKRSGNYPIPSSDIVLLISNVFNVSTDWLFKGDDVVQENHVNNITIGNTKINGDKNITNSNDVSMTDNNEYIEIIKKQQDQINKLLEMMMNK